MWSLKPAGKVSRRILHWGLIGIALSALAGAARAQQQGRYLYVAVPASELDAREVAPAILIFDINNGHKFVRRIPAHAGGRPPSQQGAHARGMAADTAGRRLYVSITAGIVAIDLTAEKVVWQKDYGGFCCDRLDVTPDGRTIYAPAFGRPKWNVIRARDGELMTTIDVTGLPRQTIFSRDGSRAYLGAWESRVILVVDTATHKPIREVGPFTSYVCPFAVNNRGTLAFANVDGLVGFEVGDLNTGLVLDRVEVEGSDTPARNDYECPAHGIALTPDERELWVADGMASRLHIFDAATYPPAAVRSLELSVQPRWVTFGLDGRYAYVSTGDVIDRTLKKTIAVLQDEHGTRVRSEKMLELETVNGKR